eukprot:GEZU01031644.1.p1 GENE.GEZU01031644.1~~GEZU01031644.1.p1  ORF type:complete len:104 (+),score=14.74 GEZU01031644.1:25-336(+)
MATKEKWEAFDPYKATYKQLMELWEEIELSRSEVPPYCFTGKDSWLLRPEYSNWYPILLDAHCEDEEPTHLDKKAYVLAWQSYRAMIDEAKMFYTDHTTVRYI